MIYGERIRLRAMTRDDLPLFTAWLNDPEVIQGLTQHLPFSVEEEERWYEKMLDFPRAEHPLVIEIPSETEGWETIGNCNLMHFDWRVRQAEFGIVIGAKQHWNKVLWLPALGVSPSPQGLWRGLHQIRSECLQGKDPWPPALPCALD